jgi:arylsulfatase A-like enzyme
MVLAGKRQVSMVPIARRLGIVRALGGDAVVQPAQHAVTYRQLHEEALDSIVDSRLNLVFVHLSVPHPPAIYDAAKDDFSNGPANTYMDNLRLVDRTVRDIRLTLEKAGLWDSSTILMTADHPLRLNRLTVFAHSLVGSRIADHYTQTSEVPYLLKLAGQKRGFAYNSAIQTVVTKDLLLAIMKGEITQPEQVAAWLDHNPPRR